ncbi:Vitamin B12 ABC transporter [Klebsiella variicola]|uniref:Vitamin B12 ABC transporter n=1 Tax=Klebsiella variicola TaxID=244366 RepID=A0A7H4MM93_KLEVA|nr:Vitamin B12 ABC transporter [Klebsiella variicola]
MGGFGGVDWQQLWLMIALLPVLCWVCLQSQPLNLLALGEVSARQLGLRCGYGASCWWWRPAGWSALASRWRGNWLYRPGDPHILRLCGLSDHRVLLRPACWPGRAPCWGRISLPDWRFSAAELPIGVVTATLGAPVFIWLLLRFAGAGIARRRRQGRRRFRLTSL